MQEISCLTVLIMSWGRDQRINNGRYQILDRIGTGGFGVTYRAIDLKAPSPDNIVAIKTVNEKRQRQANFEQHQENFLNEAVSLAKCRHPHVIRVDRVFQEAGLWAMVMEFVAGESLEDYILGRGCLEEAEAIGIITKVGDAVSYVHVQELLHRDIKPANILIRSNGEPVLIDFGLARGFVAGITGSMTNSQSPHYSPPEQGQRRGDFRPALDIYALAATLYSCVTGDLPPLAEIRVVRDALKPPQEINNRLSDRINRAILIGMALVVGDRSKTVADWLNLLLDPPMDHKKFTFETATIEVVGGQINIIKTQKQAEYLEFDLGAGMKLEMVAIPAGSFLMGQSAAEQAELIKLYGEKKYQRLFASELPQHLVNISAIYFGKYPITQGQYLAVMGVNPSDLQRGDFLQFSDLPVVRVSWHDAQEFCIRLSNKIGRKFSWVQIEKAGNKQAR
jgi:Protein kinase domain/Sulfatase-modifying factor enzyme 1